MGLAHSLDRGTKGTKMDVPRIVVKPGEGRSVWLGGMGVVFKVSGADTGGLFAVVEHPIEPGRLVPPHVHLHEDEYSCVLEGTIGARVGDREVVVGPGSYLIKPRGLMHTSGTPAPVRLVSWR
jgi:quercetin dioxygenase-like cupin family protein